MKKQIIKALALIAFALWIIFFGYALYVGYNETKQNECETCKP